jgi:hypothetical protein
MIGNEKGDVKVVRSRSMNDPWFFTFREDRLECTQLDFTH